MITNNNLFRVKSESDVKEVIDDNKNKSVCVVYLIDEIKDDIELLNFCNKNKDIIVLIADINNYESDGLIIIDKIPCILYYNKQLNEQIKINLNGLIF